MHIIFATQVTSAQFLLPVKVWASKSLTFDMRLLIFLENLITAMIEYNINDFKIKQLMAFYVDSIRLQLCLQRTHKRFKDRSKMSNNINQLFILIFVLV